MVGLIKAEMTVGPKGQIVIPKSIRQVADISPGSKVIVALEGDKIVVEKPKTDLLEIIEKYKKYRRKLKLPKNWRYLEIEEEYKKLGIL